MNEQDLLIAIRADNAQLVQKLSESRTEMNKLKGSGTGASDRIGASFNGLIGKAGAIGATIFAVKQLTTGLIDASEQGAKIKKIETSYNNLTDSVGASGTAMLATLNDISAGSIDNLAIMKSSSLAIKLMGEDAIRSLPALMEIAVASSNTTGESVEQSFRDVITATARQSVEILDNVGIAATTTRKYIAEYAKSIGTTADKLDDAQKKAAFFYAVTKAGGDIVKAQGGHVSDLVSGYDRMGTSWKNLADSLSTQLNPALDAMGNRVASLLNALNKLVNINSSDNQLSEAREQVQALTNDIARYQKAVSDGGRSKNYYAGLIKQFTPDLEFWKARVAELEKAQTSKSKKKTTTSYTYSSGGAATQKVEDKIDSYLLPSALAKANKDLSEITTNQELLYKSGLIDAKTYWARMFDIEQEYNDRRVLASAEAAEQIRQRNENLLLATLGLKSQEYSATTQMLDNLSTLMQAKDRRLFNLGKAASIARAVVSTYEGAAKALTYGPIIGPILAATVIAAGAAQVANIRRQEYGSSSVDSNASAASSSDTASAIKYQQAINTNGMAVQQFAAGVIDVPSDMYAYIHKGETIVPATFTQSIQRGDMALAGSESAIGGGDTYNVTHVAGSIIDIQGLMSIIDEQRNLQARNRAAANYYRKSVYSK